MPNLQLGQKGFTPRSGLLALVVVALAAATVAGEAPAAAESICANGGIASYPAPPATDFPFAITQGPGGTWYSEGDRIVRVRSNGTLDQFELPDPQLADAGWISWSAGPSVWFSDRGTGRIGSVDGRGNIVEYQVPDASDGSPASPNGQVQMGKYVWFTDPPTGRIGRLDPATGNFKMFTVPTPDSWPLGITVGPDGALWFTERRADKVGRMTTSGQFTEWNLQRGSFPNRIVVGPDNAIWFTELFTSQVGRIDMSGTLQEYHVDGGPVGIAAGPDGNLYVALFFSGQLGQVDLSGHLTRTWDLPGAFQVASSHGSIWLTTDDVAQVHVSCPQ
jgi:virginiamycin B lyase